MLLPAVIGVVGVLVLGVLVEVFSVLRARAPAVVSCSVVGTGPAREGSRIPRVIWTYWDTLPPPEVVARCLRLWQRVAPDHEIRLLDRESCARWLDAGDKTAGFDALPAYRQADWLRLRLLHRHGGLWIDGSTLLTTDLDWVHRRRDEHGAGVVGFYIDRYTTDSLQPIVENWFIASLPGDPFIAAWATELDHALSLGEQGYLDALRREGTLGAAAQAIPEDMQAYLIMHLAASRVLQRDPARYRLALQRAEDMAFAFHAALRWRKRHLYARLALTPAPRRVPALIKLRGGDRTVLERGLARGWVWPRSLLARLLEIA